MLARRSRLPLSSVEGLFPDLGMDLPLREPDPDVLAQEEVEVQDPQVEHHQEANASPRAKGGLSARGAPREDGMGNQRAEIA